MLLLNVRRLLFLKEINLNIKNLIYFIFIFFYSKDTCFFKNFIIYVLENTYFKKHKKFLYGLQSLLFSIFSIYKLVLGIFGLYIKISGKLGVGGNLKKRNYVFKIGNFSFTKKKQKLAYTCGIVRTYSGVLSLNIYLVYA